MEKEFVPYKQALELKELGFDEPCMKMEYHHKNPHIDWHVPNELDCPIPLYQQAFRWFRKKYGLVGWVYGKRVYRYCIESPIPTDGQLNFSPFKSYEDAELACLQKLIEIVKEK